VEERTRRLRLVADEYDQVLRLDRFRQDHPAILVGAGNGWWQAVIPAQDGEIVTGARYDRYRQLVMAALPPGHRGELSHRARWLYRTLHAAELAGPASKIIPRISRAWPSDAFCSTRRHRRNPTGRPIRVSRPVPSCPAVVRVRAPPPPHRTDCCRSIRRRAGVKGGFARTLTSPAGTAALDAGPEAYHNPAAVWWGPLQLPRSSGPGRRIPPRASGAPTLLTRPPKKGAGRTGR